MKLASLMEMMMASLRELMMAYLLVVARSQMPDAIWLEMPLVLGFHKYHNHIYMCKWVIHEEHNSQQLIQFDF